MLGPCTRVEGDGGSARAAFLAAHPNSTYYADFRDFGFWKLHVDSVRYIGGYGRMSWIDKAEWQTAEPDPLGPSAAGIIAHMNADHADAMVLYCKAFSKATEITSASMTGIDRYGFEMSAKTREGPRPIRLAFTTPIRLQRSRELTRVCSPRMNHAMPTGRRAAWAHGQETTVLYLSPLVRPRPARRGSAAGLLGVGVPGGPAGADASRMAPTQS